MLFRIADTPFTDSLASLTGEEQKLAKTTAFDRQLKPAAPGMQFHKLDKVKDTRFWSVRVGRQSSAFYLAILRLLRYDLTSKNRLNFRSHIMANLATTKMSSKGQVVIPEDIRKRLNLKTGSQFVVVGENDVVILKEITPPSMNEFDTLITEVRKQSKEAGLKQSDITQAIAKVRGRK